MNKSKKKNAWLFDKMQKIRYLMIAAEERVNGRQSEM